MLARLWPLLALAAIEATPALAALSEKVSSVESDRNGGAFAVLKDVGCNLALREFPAGARD